MQRNNSGGGDLAWADVKQAYEGFELTLPQISSRFGFSLSQIAYRRRREGWAARPLGWNAIAKAAKAKKEDDEKAARRAKSGGEHLSAGRTSMSIESNSSSTDKPAGPPLSFHEEIDLMMSRLLAITKEEISIIEERMMNGEHKSAVDSTRNTRSIGALIKNLEKLTEFNEQSRGADDKRGSVAGITVDEADRIRRDLAQRIERLTKG